MATREHKRAQSEKHPALFRPFCGLLCSFAAILCRQAARTLLRDTALARHAAPCNWVKVTRPARQSNRIQLNPTKSDPIQVNPSKSNQPAGGERGGGKNGNGGKIKVNQG
jgi:hypothetical protein